MATLGGEKYSKFEGITDDILIEILCRLPFRVVYQCKVVSKRWHSLVSSPYFAKHYRCLHDHKDNIYLLTSFVGSGFQSVEDDQVIELSNNKLVQFKWDDCSKNQSFKLRDILFVSSDLFLMITYDDEVDYFTLVIYNPLTKQSSSLPWPPHPYDGLTSMTNFEGCLRCKDNPTLYKVVLVQPRQHKQSEQIDEWFLDFFVYSSQDGKWSKFSILAPPNIKFIKQILPWRFRSQYATVCNDKLYWTRDIIIGYDPFNKPNECEFINFPDNSGIIYGCITNVQGCIRLYDPRMTSASTMSFWDLKTDHVWSRKCVDLSGIRWDDYIISSITQPISLHIKGFNPFHGDVVYVLIWHRVLLAINLQSKTDEQINADYKLSSVRFITDFKQPVQISRLFPFVPPSWPTPLGVQVRQDVRNLLTETLDQKRWKVLLIYL